MFKKTIFKRFYFTMQIHSPVDDSAIMGEFEFFEHVSTNGISQGKNSRLKR